MVSGDTYIASCQLYAPALDEKDLPRDDASERLIMTNKNLKHFSNPVLPTLLMVFFSVNAFGFDDVLKGFILSAGAGLAEDITVPYVQIDTAKGYGKTSGNTALCLDFRVGYNFGNRFEFAFANKSDVMYPYTTMILNNADALELSYYVRKVAPLVFISGSAGVAMWRYPFGGAMDQQFAGIGFCCSLGTGVEFIKHLSAVLEYQFSQPGYYDKIEVAYQDTVSGQTDWKQVQFAQIYNTSAIRLTLRYTFY